MGRMTGGSEWPEPLPNRECELHVIRRGMAVAIRRQWLRGGRGCTSHHGISLLSYARDSRFHILNTVQLRVELLL